MTINKYLRIFIKLPLLLMSFFSVVVVKRKLITNLIKFSYEFMILRPLYCNYIK